jgi:predicted TIM-barrel fold metal-dependent hydrolase
MPLQDHMKLVSVDDHVVEHPLVWQTRLPERLRETGPRIVEIGGETRDAHGAVIPAGAQVWSYQGNVYNRIALDAVAGKKREEFSVDPYRYDQIIPGCYDPVARVRDMDEDGIWAQLCFPTFPRFAGTMFLEGVDRELADLSVRAYNDFMIEEWCGTVPGRQIPMIITQLWDPALAAQEIERCAAKGAKAVSFVENPVPLGLPSFHTEHWDPIFAAAQETGMPLCMHFGTSGAMPITAPDAPFITMIVLMGTNSMSTTVDLLFSPVFQRFPRLKVALSEGGVGWIPYILERADYAWERHRYYTGINQEARPSEVFREHFWGCFIDDEAGMRERHAIGVDRITWECDYPHSDSNWPHARERLGEMLADVPDDEAHQIAELNARTLLNFTD